MQRLQRPAPPFGCLRPRAPSAVHPASIRKSTVGPLEHGRLAGVAVTALRAAARPLVLWRYCLAARRPERGLDHALQKVEHLPTEQCDARLCGRLGSAIRAGGGSWLRELGFNLTLAQDEFNARILEVADEEQATVDVELESITSAEEVGRESQEGAARSEARGDLAGGATEGLEGSAEVDDGSDIRLDRKSKDGAAPMRRTSGWAISRQTRSPFQNAWRHWMMGRRTLRTSLQRRSRGGLKPGAGDQRQQFRFGYRWRQGAADISHRLLADKGVLLGVARGARRRETGAIRDRFLAAERSRGTQGYPLRSGRPGSRKQDFAVELFLKLITIMSRAYRRRFGAIPAAQTLNGQSTGSERRRCLTIWLRESPESNECSESRSSLSMGPNGLTSPSSSSGPVSEESGELLQEGLQLAESTSLRPK